MARIVVSRSHGRYRASLSGALSYRDLGRLERSCGAALEQQPPPLVVDLTAVTTLDRSAEALLRHLAARGVEIVSPAVDRQVTISSRPRQARRHSGEISRR